MLYLLYIVVFCGIITCMKLNYNKNSKDPIYYVQKGFRVGKKATTKNIFRIGRHSELLKITDDPLAYAKKVVAKYNEEEKEKNEVRMEVNIDFSEKLKFLEQNASSSTRRNIGYFYLQEIYHKLEIRKFFMDLKKDSKIAFDPNEVNRFLTFARILAPDSKLGTHDHLDRFYEQPDFDYVHILRTMDLLCEHRNEYLSHLYKKSCAAVKRNTSVCYYDCTNYYTEIESQDPDYVDETTGEVIKGLRRYGPSKEHRPNPIVEMGLFMDRDGIPLSMCLVPGSQNEQTTAIPLEKKVLEMMGKSKVIYCADAGLSSLDIRNFNSMGGRAFVVTQSIKKLSAVLQAAVFNDCDYRLLSDGRAVSTDLLHSFDKTDEANLPLYNDTAYKVLSADHAYDLGLYETVITKSGKTRRIKSKAVLKQKIIVTFSRKMMEYQRHVRNGQIERARAILQNADPDTFKKGPNDVTRFIQRDNKDSKDVFSINEALIEEEARYDGYYAIATNLEDDVKDILAINAGRYKIEDCFRIMKTELSARPIYHQKKDRITAHFLICYTALLIYRLLEKQLNDKGEHFTVEDVIETLRNMEVANVNDMFYASTYTCSRVSSNLESLTGLGLDKKYYQLKELNRKVNALK